jgi:Domain of unknown function (DUF4920)
MKLFTIFLALASLVAAAPLKLGKPLALNQPTAIGKIVAAPDSYVGKTVQVKGRVTEVCQNMGCWMHLVDPASQAMIRIKVRDGEIVFPKDSLGKTAVAEGKLVKLELTKEQAIAQAKHEAEENNRPFDPKSITGPKTVYQIQGTGAEILD